MPIRNAAWYAANSTRNYPVDDAATAVDDAGVPLPTDILVDAQIYFPRDLGSHLYLTALTVTDRLVTALFGVADGPAAAPDGGAQPPGFRLVAAVTLPQPMVPGRHYGVRAVAPGVAGWVVFGAGVDEPYTGRFATVGQGMLLARCGRPYQPLPVPGIGRPGAVALLDGVVALRGGTDVRVAVETLAIAGDGGDPVLTEAIVIGLDNAINRDVFARYAGPCAGRPESGNCRKPPLERINNIQPDCDGDIRIDFRGLTVTPLEGGGGQALDLALGLSAACADDLPSNGYLPAAGDDQCHDSGQEGPDLGPDDPAGTIPPAGGPQPGDPDAYEPDQTMDQAGFVRPDGTLHHHSIHAPGNCDWSWFYLGITSNLTIATAGDAGGNTTLTLNDAAGIQLAADATPDGYAALTHPAVPPGIYYVHVCPVGQDLIAAYTLAVQSVATVLGSGCNGPWHENFDALPAGTAGTWAASSPSVVGQWSTAVEASPQAPSGLHPGGGPDVCKLAQSTSRTNIDFYVPHGCDRGAYSALFKRATTLVRPHPGVASNGGIVVNYREDGGAARYLLATVDCKGGNVQIHRFNGTALTQLAAKPIGPIVEGDWFELSARVRTSTVSAVAIELLVTVYPLTPTAPVTTLIHDIPVADFGPTDGLYGLASRSAQATFAFFHLANE